MGIESTKYELPKKICMIDTNDEVTNHIEHNSVLEIEKSDDASVQ